MFNPANLAKEIFGILRSFDYVVNIFDFDGNRVYEPEEARRFFASPKNITVSVHEDGENSSIKMFLSKSIDITEVSGLIATMRATSSKFGVLFNVRKYERELKPKDLAPNGSSDFDAGVSLSSAESPKEVSADAPKSAELDFDDHSHNPEGEKLERVADEVGNLTKDFKEIVGLLHNKKVKESMDNDNINLNEAEGQTVNLGILGVETEADAWEQFKKGKLPLAGPVDLSVGEKEAESYIVSYESSHGGTSFDHVTAVKAIQLTRIAKAIKDNAPLLSAAFMVALDRYVTGSAEKVIDAVVNKAINAASYGEDDNGGFTNAGSPKLRTDGAKKGQQVEAGKDTISIKEFNGGVERQAWQDFVDDHIDFSAAVDFNSVKLGATANKLAMFLNLVAQNATMPGFANMLSTFATDIDEGRSTPFKVKVAKHAIEIAQHGKVDVGESLIMTESIKDFAKWFDGLSSVAVFEGSFGDNFPYDDRSDTPFDLSWKTTKENFSPETFLDVVGASDFGYGDDTLGNDEKTVQYDDLKSSLVNYLQGELSSGIDTEYPQNDDAGALADEYLPAVIDTMAASGWTVEVPADNDLEEGSDMVCKCFDECHCDTGEVVESDELSTEDVILPSRADDDLRREVTVDRGGDDEMDRIIALARGNSAAYSPRSPQP